MSHLEAYPKIETLFNRDPKTFKVIEGQFRFPELTNIKTWWITEKIDGTNIRIAYFVDGGARRLLFLGRTNNAQMPTFLLSYLQQTFTLDKMKSAFPDLKDEDTVILFGEGYGPKIQKGGGNYSKEVSFRLFDVKVGKWWLEQENIWIVAANLGLKHVPDLYSPMTLEEAVDLVKSEPKSIVAQEDGGKPDSHKIEGIVARTRPLLLRRNGERLMWKLKIRDFTEGERE